MLKLLLLIMDIPLFCFGKKISEGEQSQIVDALEAGDVVLVADRLFPLWQLIMRLLLHSNYYHSAIYEGGGRVVEATTCYPAGSGVKRTSIYEYISGYKTCCVVRPPYASSAARRKAVDFALSQLGKPYDYAMQPHENGAYYCTKLVAAALQTAGIEIKQTKSLLKNGFAPDGFFHAENAKIVYGKNENILPKLALKLLCFAVICCLPAAYLSAFIGIIVAGGLCQFYCTPSNSVIRKIYAGKQTLIIENGKLTMETPITVGGSGAVGVFDVMGRAVGALRATPLQRTIDIAHLPSRKDEQGFRVTRGRR